MSAKAKAPQWDKPPRKARSDSKLKNLPEEDQEAMWLLMHPTDADTPAWSLEQVLVHLQEDHEITCSISTLSEWHSHYALQRRIRNAGERARQAQLEWVQKNPDATPEDLERLGQMVFTAETIEGGNVKAFVALAKVRLQAQKLGLDSRRIAILEARAKAADEAAAQLRKLREGGSMLPEQEREAILNKMDEILGLKSEPKKKQ